LFTFFLGPSVSETPAIKSFYCDPAFVKSGGGGNYILSTSTSGYTAMSGGATAMVTDGYGIFYNFEPQQVF
jgi:carnitine O-octanoyltransferase